MRRGWILWLAGLLAGLAISPRAEAFGGHGKGYAYSYSGSTGGHWVPVAPAVPSYPVSSYSYTPVYQGQGWAGGGTPGSGYGGGYYGLQGYNNPNGGFIYPGYYRVYNSGYRGMRR